MANDALASGGNAAATTYVSCGERHSSLRASPRFARFGPPNAIAAKLRRGYTCRGRRRTKSAVHEALQRRAGNRPGDGFSGLLGGGSKLNPPRVFANSRKYPTQESCTQSFAQRLRSRPRELWPTRSVRRATPPAALRRHAAASSAHLAATYLIENAQLRFSERLCRHGQCGSR